MVNRGSAHRERIARHPPTNQREKDNCSELESDEAFQRDRSNALTN